MSRHSKSAHNTPDAGASATRGFVMPEGRFGAPRPVGPQATGAMPPQVDQGTAAMPPQPSRPVSSGTGAMPVVSPMGPTSGGYVPGYQVNARPPKKHRGLKIFGIVMASILGAIALVYFAGVIVFSGRFFPQSTIIGMDISGKTPEEVHQMLDNVLGDYTFKVEGPGLSLTLDATDMGMALDSQSIADGLLAEMNPWAWPYEVFQRHDDTDDLVSTLENSKLADTLTAAVEEANARGTAPKNATVAYDADEGGYVVVPEEEGNTLLSDVVIDEVTRGTVNFAPKVTLSDAVLAKPTVTRDDPALAEARDAANKYLGGALALTMAGAEKMGHHRRRDRRAHHLG